MSAKAKPAGDTPMLVLHAKRIANDLLRRGQPCSMVILLHDQKTMSCDMGDVPADDVIGAIVCLVGGQPQEELVWLRICYDHRTLHLHWESHGVLLEFRLWIAELTPGKTGYKSGKCIEVEDPIGQGAISFYGKLREAMLTN